LWNFLRRLVQQRPAGDDEAIQVTGGDPASTGAQGEGEGEAEEETKRPSLRDYLADAWRGEDGAQFKLPDKGDVLLSHAVLGGDGSSVPYRGIREALAAAATDPNDDDAETADIKAQLRAVKCEIDVNDQRLAQLLMLAADIWKGSSKKRKKMSDYYSNVLFEERIGEAPINLSRMTDRADGRRPNTMYLLLRANDVGVVGYECTAREWQEVTENVAFEPRSEQSPPPYRGTKCVDIDSAPSTGNKHEDIFCNKSKPKRDKRKRRQAPNKRGDGAKKGGLRQGAADESTGTNDGGGGVSDEEAASPNERAQVPAAKRDLFKASDASDLARAEADPYASDTTLVTSTPESHTKVLETPLQAEGTRRIDRHPSDATLLEFADEALKDLKGALSHPNKLFGAMNNVSKAHERTLDGIMVRGHTLAGPRAPAATSD